MLPTVAVVLKGYPRLSETFIAQEIRALELHGFRLYLFSLRHPTDPAIHPIHAEIEAPVAYLPEYVADDIPRVLRAWWRIRKRDGYRRARAVFFRDLWRDFTPNRARRFAQALVLANEIPSWARRAWPGLRGVHDNSARYSNTFVSWSVMYP